MLGQNIGRVGLPDMSAGGRPSLTLDFVSIPVLNEKITFTRTGTTATYFNSAGVLTSAAADQPRFDYNPSTLAARGLLIEEARTNLLLQSENFATTWVKDANSTLTVDAEVAPNGLTVADKLAVGTSTFPQITQSVTSSASSTYTFSCFVKAGGLNFIQLRLRNTATNANFFRAIFDLSTGAISLPANGGTGTYSSGSAAFVGNGWWRLSITGVPDTGGGAAIQAVAILTFDANGTVATPTNSSATDGVFFFGAQLEAGAFPTSYIPTTTTALTRSADVASVNTLAPWYNATEGTLFAEWTSFLPNGSQIAYVTDFTDNPASASSVQLAIQSRALNNQIRVWQSVTGGGLDESIQPSFTAFQGKAATSYGGATNVSASANGGAVVTMPSPLQSAVFTNLLLGSAAGTTGQLDGWLRRITYYPRRLSNVELQSITTP